MVIPEVKPEDAGEYRCVASNKYSDESCSCIVNVTSTSFFFFLSKRKIFKKILYRLEI